MKKYQLAIVLLAAVCSTLNAKKKEVPEILFGVKSGIITISSDMGEMSNFGAAGGFAGFAGAENANLDMSEMVQQIYFDDYGRKTATVNVSGENITRTISIGDSTYTINEKENTATVMPVFGGRGGSFMGGMNSVSIGTIGQIDWMNLDKKTIKRNKITEIGEEDIAGVKCINYSMRISSSMGFTSNITASIYKGVVLKSETESEWANTSQTAIGFDENANIPETMFTLPKGCKVSAMSMGGMGGGFGGGMGGGFGGGMGGGFGGDMGGGFGGGMGGF